MKTPRKSAESRRVSFTFELTPEEHTLLESRGRSHHFGRGGSGFARVLFFHVLEAYTRMEPHVGLDGFITIMKGLGKETARKRTAKTNKEMDRLISALEWTERYARSVRDSYRGELAARVTPKRVAR